MCLFSKSLCEMGKVLYIIYADMLTSNGIFEVVPKDLIDVGFKEFVV